MVLLPNAVERVGPERVLAQGGCLRAQGALPLVVSVQEHPPRKRRQAVDVEHSIQVVDLVL